MAREPDALWEEALQQQEEDENRLVDEIVELAVHWADGDADELKRAERILARTQYLKGEKMADYLVTWEIDADNADSPRKAALFARNAQTRRSTWATVFHVVNKETGEVTRLT